MPFFQDARKEALTKKKAKEKERGSYLDDSTLEILNLVGKKMDKGSLNTQNEVTIVRLHLYNRTSLEKGRNNSFVTSAVDYITVIIIIDLCYRKMVMLESTLCMTLTMTV